MTESEIVVQAESISLGTLQAGTPRDAIARAGSIASVLAKIIKDQKLY